MKKWIAPLTAIIAMHAAGVQAQTCVTTGEASRSAPTNVFSASLV